MYDACCFFAARLPIIICHRFVRLRCLLIYLSGLAATVYLHVYNNNINNNSTNNNSNNNSNHSNHNSNHINHNNNQ